MPYCQTKDGQIFYQTFGNKSNPALIFSNSLGTDHTMWQPQVDALQDKFFIVAYDTRGHGKSDVPKGSYTINDLGGDVIALLNELSIQKANFCGISMGGLTGLWLAIHQPGHFDKIIVSNTAAKIGQESAWQDRAKLVLEHGLESVASSAPSRWFSESFVARNGDTVDRLIKNLSNQSAEGYSACCQALAIADVRDELKEIKLPILSIGGELDPVTTVSDAQYIVDNVSGAILATIQASHIANIERPDDFNKIIEGFVSG
ncbi:3-oxoadipate enol-lactonase [Moraxella cuniculi DSM 21768]|uniref:3-oxoadipate enol-lactonase n=1 Tax=Moraxella cuniculi DSM 21768 TaxID=1122245 RepID=A0A1N7FIE6_9GAMM|nr:3-oxoadipate enol-lactonase [Moraxella cuniculi]OOS02258.1 3-oxoadipate enol-lactonase [Moraxella cuniculi]SIS00060.1 3-oxoadipate enol-lactonase [Moraxella cuniculi DSM 21768]